MSSFVHHFKPLGEFKLELLSRNSQFGLKSVIFCSVWPWNLMDDLKKQQGTSSMLHYALCIISKPLVNSNWSYSPETLKSGQNRQFFFTRVTLKFYRWPWKTTGLLFYVASSFMHHFIAISEFKLKLQSGIPPVGSGTPAFRLGSRIDPHRHRGVVKVHWRVPWVGGLFSWVVATFTL